MTFGGSADWLGDPELARLRREWVAAFRAWRQAAGDDPPPGAEVSDGQHAVLRRYRDAEAAYFAYSRKLADSY